MKKLLLVGVGMLFMAGVIKADEYDGMTGGFGGSKVWRSSDTQSNDNWVVLATGNIIIGYVQVSSKGFNSEIKFCQVFSTVNFRVHGSSWAYPSGRYDYYTGTVPAGGSWGFPTNNVAFPSTDMIYVMRESTMGWKYNTSGAVPAKLRILWDYKIPPR
jgi:hypothetical protein